MFNFIKRLNYEWFSLLAVLFLITSSLITIYSLSLSSEEGGTNLFYKQIIFYVVSLPFFIFFSIYNYQNWKVYSGLLYLVSLILLSLVLVFGKDIRGTSSWFDLGFFNFQPVEIVKIFVIIALAGYFSKKINTNIGLKEVGISFLYILIPVLLTLKQPDFGSATVILVIWFGMLVITNINKKIIIALVMASGLLVLGGWQYFLKDYQKERIEIFFNPHKDALGSGYNVIQSMIAVGSGGMTGKGMGYGSQSQLNFLPEKHNDFIFAVISEENGFRGSLLIILVFGFLFYRMVIIAGKSKDYFGWFIVNGVIIMLLFQVIINIGMNIGIIPIAGLSLPFISYGGSFIIASMIAFGLTQSVWINRKKESLNFDNELG